MTLEKQDQNDEKEKGGSYWAFMIRIGMVKTVNIVSALWNLSPAILFLSASFPEFLWIGASSWESETQPNNGNRVHVADCDFLGVFLSHIEEQVLGELMLCMNEFWIKLRKGYLLMDSAKQRNWPSGRAMLSTHDFLPEAIASRPIQCGVTVQRIDSI
jgi:hypothetical protein